MADIVVRRWTNGPVKILGIWLGPALQLVNWSEVLSKMALLTQTWSAQLSLKGRTKIANVFIASIITYHLAVVSYSHLWLNKLERMLFCFLWIGRGPLVGRSICCQNAKRWVRDAVTKNALRFRHRWLYLDGEQVWTSFVKQIFPRFTLQNWTHGLSADRG